MQTNGGQNFRFPSNCSLCLLWVGWIFLPLFIGWAPIHLPHLCTSQSAMWKTKATLDVPDRKAFSAGNEVPTTLWKGLEVHESGANSKLTGHGTAGVIQKWRAAAEPQRSESYKNHRQCCSCCSSKADALAVKQGVWAPSNQCLLDPCYVITATGKFILPCFANFHNSISLQFLTF